ncbi:MAG: hypothetical protein PF448_04180 [Bacteroidales bacterium]|jgi:hypothetical protein|nr:hypothetical protein [Bacteroidales bacterium]
MKTKRSKVIFFSLILIGILTVLWVFLSNQKSPLKVDVSDIEVNIEVQRFDKDLFTDYESIEMHARNLENQYPDFFPLFTQQIIKIGHSGNKSFNEYLDAFITDYTVTQAKDAVFDEFQDVSDIEKSLNDGFKYFLYYFPEYQTPKVITFIAGFNHSVVTTDKLIGIGLDKYLGAECEFYHMMKIPQYAAKNMRKEMIPVDCMSAWAEMEFPNTDSTDYLAYSMIYQGKLLYFLDAMYPEMSDHLKIGFLEEKIAYCQHFEAFMWEYLVSENLLFSTDYLQQRKFLGDAPFTAAFGNDSPGRAAAWIGWQIVRAYVRENKVDLPALMQETDYQKIMNLSYYDPK